jgi:hypothetical protein
MIFVKINETLYPAVVNGRVADNNWDNRPSKAITLEMDYETAINLFVDGLVWSIVERIDVPTYDEHGVQIGTEIKEFEYDNSDYNLAGDLTNHRDGTITTKMGKLTELEEAYLIMFGGN